MNRRLDVLEDEFGPAEEIAVFYFDGPNLLEEQTIGEPASEETRRAYREADEDPHTTIIEVHYSEDAP